MDSSKLQCPVCLDTFHKPVSLHCGHSLCKDCADSKRRIGSAECPVCKVPFPDVLRPNLALCAIVEQFAEKKTKKKVANQERITKTRRNRKKTVSKKGGKVEANGALDDPISLAIRQLNLDSEESAKVDSTSRPESPAEMMLSDDGKDDSESKFFVPRRPLQRAPRRRNRRPAPRRKIVAKKKMDENSSDPIARALRELSLGQQNTRMNAEGSKPTVMKGTQISANTLDPISAAVDELSKSSNTFSKTEPHKFESKATTYRAKELRIDDPIATALRELHLSKDAKIKSISRKQGPPAAPRKTRKQRAYKIRGRDRDGGVVLSPAALRSCKSSHDRRMKESAAATATRSFAASTNSSNMVDDSSYSPSKRKKTTDTVADGFTIHDDDEDDTDALNIDTMRDDAMSPDTVGSTDGFESADSSIDAKEAGKSCDTNNETERTDREAQRRERERSEAEERRRERVEAEAVAARERAEAEAEERQRAAEVRAREEEERKRELQRERDLRRKQELQRKKEEEEAARVAAAARARMEEAAARAEEEEKRRARAESQRKQKSRNNFEAKQQDEIRRVLKCAKDDHYAVLSLPLTTDESVTRKAILKKFRKLALLLHPDKNTSGTKDVAEKAFQRISRAREVLCSPSKRAAYHSARARTMSSNPRASASQPKTMPFQTSSTHANRHTHARAPSNSYYAPPPPTAYGTGPYPSYHGGYGYAYGSGSYGSSTERRRAGDSFFSSDAFRPRQGSRNQSVPVNSYAPSSGSSSSASSWGYSKNAYPNQQQRRKKRVPSSKRRQQGGLGAMFGSGRSNWL
eukprot:g2388.t1